MSTDHPTPADLSNLHQRNAAYYREQAAKARTVNERKRYEAKAAEEDRLAG